MIFCKTTLQIFNVHFYKVTIVEQRFVLTVLVLGQWSYFFVHTGAICAGIGEYRKPTSGHSKTSKGQRTAGRIDLLEPQIASRGMFILLFYGNLSSRLKGLCTIVVYRL